MWKYYSETTVTASGSDVDQDLSALVAAVETEYSRAEVQFHVVTGALSAYYHLPTETGIEIVANDEWEIGPFQYGQESDSIGYLLVQDGSSAVIHTFVKGGD